MSGTGSARPAGADHSGDRARDRTRWRRGALTVGVAGLLIAGAVAVVALRPDANTSLTAAALATKPVTVGDLAVSDRLQGTLQRTAELVVVHRISGAPLGTGASSSTGQSTDSGGGSSLGLVSVAALLHAALADDPVPAPPGGAGDTVTGSSAAGAPTAEPFAGPIPTAGQTIGDTSCPAAGSPASEPTTSSTTTSSTTTSSTPAPPTTSTSSTSTADPGCPTVTSGPLSTSGAGGSGPVVPGVAPGVGGGVVPSNNGAGGVVGGANRGVVGGANRGVVSGANRGVVSAAAQTTPRQMLTSVAAAGTDVRSGDVLYSVEGQPVVALTGAIPAWRDLSTSSTDGADVAQLESALTALGYDDGGAMVIDNHYNASTARAVSAWQRGRGLEAAGTVTLGSVVFVPDTTVVSAVSAAVGDQLADGTAVLRLAEPTQLVVAEVPAALRSVVTPGLAVQVSGEGGTVSRLGSASGSQGVVVQAFITLTGPLDQADGSAVTARFTVTDATNVLLVPVDAVASRIDGSYAVYAVDSSGSAGNWIPIEVHGVANGLVAATGAGLGPGMAVAVPD
jgi:Putative peptidoglycan binding domain